ncbi:MAG TPA: TIM44-like domain-containing protein [Candidatus Dormibacteraeota bacterium]|nr:TIM44-like domain-containing protein [Candidatus Dormibacteraeota bacterium]
MTAPLLAASGLLARAGGGHSFGGGGGGSGGFRSGGGSSFSGGGGGHGFFFFPFFFGGGGGGGAILGLLLFLVLVVVVIVVIARVFAMFRSPRPMGAGADLGSSYGAGSVPAPPPPSSTPYDDTRPIGVPEGLRGAMLPGSSPMAMASDGVADGIAAITAHDPAFDESAFIGEAERGFFVVQQAWTELKPDLSRRVMADGIWQQHRTQIEQYVAQGRRNVLEQLAVGNARIIAAHSDQSYDTLTLRFLAACADYDIDVKSGRIVRGNRSVDQWSEDWVFQRSSSATTNPKGGTLSSKCPNCGAPLDLDLAGVCSYCKAPVMSGRYDWVLTRIDQV